MTDDKLPTEHNGGTHIPNTGGQPSPYSSSQPAQVPSSVSDSAKESTMHSPMPEEHTPLPGQTFGGTAHNESVQPATAIAATSTTAEPTGRIQGAIKSVKGLGEVFTKSTKGEILNGEDIAEAYHAKHAGLFNKAQKEIRDGVLNGEAAKNLKEFNSKAYSDFKPDAILNRNIVERTVASVGGNWGKAGNLEKIGRVGGSVVGLGAIISGGKDIFAPARDENGERKSSFVKTALKLAGGAAIIWASLIAGGKNKAMGIS